MGNGTTIERQIKAVEDEVKMYASRMTWHDHQKALEDAAESLKALKKIREDLKKLKIIK